VFAAPNSDSCFQIGISLNWPRAARKRSPTVRARAFSRQIIEIDEVLRFPVESGPRHFSERVSDADPSHAELAQRRGRQPRLRKLDVERLRRDGIRDGFDCQGIGEPRHAKDVGAGACVSDQSLDDIAEP
jgi:hypothetical protein